MKQNNIWIPSAFVLAVSLLSLCTAAEQAKPTMALYQAAFIGDVNAVRALIAGGANVNEVDFCNGTALLYAIYGGHPLVVKALLDAKADVNQRAGEEPLIAAVMHKESDVVTLLLDSGARVDGEKPVTALMTAVWLGQRDIAQKLIEKGANVNAAARNGMTVLAMAERSQQKDLADLLKQHGAREIAPPTTRGGGWVRTSTGSNMNPYGTPQAAAPQGAMPQSLPTDPSQAAVAKVLADPNGVLARLAASADVNNSLKPVADKARLQEEAWELRTRDNRSTLAYTVEHQFVDEMVVVRKIANEEKAVKTVADINDLLARRKVRFAAIAEDLRLQRPATPTPTTQGTTRGRGRGTTTRGRGTTTGVAPNEAMPATEPTGPSIAGGRSSAARRPQEPNRAGLDPETQTLVQAWVSANYEDKRELLKVVNESDLKDLGSLDVVATEEKAEKTSLAIEALMVLRQERVTHINEQMAKEDQRLQRQQERGTTTGTRGTRGTGGQQGTMRGGR